MARFKSKKYIGVYYETLQNDDKAYYITYKENDKKRWLKIGLHSEGIREQLCHQKRNDITSKMRLGEDLPEVAKRKIQTLNEVAKIFFDEKEIHNKQNKKTRARVEKHIQETLGDMPLNKITREQISKIQKDKSNELSPASVNFIMGQLNAIFIWAIKQELMDKNPCIHLKNIRVNNTRLRYLELEEIKTLKERLRDNKSAYYFVLLGLSTGGRLQTLCNIKVKDFKEDGMIKLYDFKTKAKYNKKGEYKGFKYYNSTKYGVSNRNTNRLQLSLYADILKRTLGLDVSPTLTVIPLVVDTKGTRIQTIELEKEY